MYCGTTFTVISRHEHAVCPRFLRGLEFDTGGSLAFFDGIGEGWWGRFSVATMLAIGALCADVPVVPEIIAFSFENIEPGSYLIVAGSDSDNDNVICDAGEACGAYPARDDLLPIEILADRSNADFSTGFSTAFEAESLGGAQGGFQRLAPRSLGRRP